MYLREDQTIGKTKSIYVYRASSLVYKLIKMNHL